jgi:hypothetical protein
MKEEQPLFFSLLPGKPYIILPTSSEILYQRIQKTRKGSGVGYSLTVITCIQINKRAAKK